MFSSLYKSMSLWYLDPEDNAFADRYPFQMTLKDTYHKSNLLLFDFNISMKFFLLHIAYYRFYTKINKVTISK